MDQAKSVGQGFVAAACVVWLIACIYVGSDINLWLGLGLFVFLAVPFFARGIIGLEYFRLKNSAQTAVKKAKSVLMALQGVGLACWFLDVISTIFTININQTSSESNVLGWPFSALGALAYYAPITFLVYYLLYKVKSKESFYSVVVITAVTMFMGLRNLNAGLHNLLALGQTYSLTAELEITGILLAVGVILASVNLVAAIKSKNPAIFRLNKL
jgi:hypothetical protein